MPELPDVEVFRRHLSATGLRRPIGRVKVLDQRMLRGTTRQRLARVLNGRELVRTRRHGKHLFARVSSGEWLVMHFGMTGLLRHVPVDHEAPEHTRLLLLYDDGSSLAFADQRRLGHVTVTGEVRDYVAEQDLGEDALRLAPGRLRDLLVEHRGALKSSLMDQTVVAGIGNIYSDEILFQAGLSPRRPAAGLADEEYRRLHRQTDRVLRMAADRGADPDRLPRTWLLRHRTDGERCPRGNGRVRRFTQAGRGAFYCPACQGG